MSKEPLKATKEEIDQWFESFAEEMRKQGVDVNAPEDSGKIYWVVKKPNAQDEDDLDIVPFRAPTDENGNLMRDKIAAKDIRKNGIVSAEWTYNNSQTPINDRQKALMYQMAQKGQLFCRDLKDSFASFKTILVKTDGKAAVFPLNNEFLSYVKPKAMEEPQYQYTEKEIEDAFKIHRVRPTPPKKPSFWKRIANTLTGGRAFKSDMEAYQDKVEKYNKMENDYQQIDKKWEDYRNDNNLHEDYKASIERVEEFQKSLEDPGRKKTYDQYVNDFTEDFGTLFSNAQDYSDRGGAFFSGIDDDPDLEKTRKEDALFWEVKGETKESNLNPLNRVKKTLEGCKVATDEKTMSAAFPLLGKKEVPAGMLKVFQAGAKIKQNLCEEAIKNENTGETITLSEKDYHTLCVCEYCAQMIGDGGADHLKLINEKTVNNMTKNITAPDKRLSPFDVDMMLGTVGTSDMRDNGAATITAWAEKQKELRNPTQPNLTKTQAPLTKKTSTKSI